MSNHLSDERFRNLTWRRTLTPAEEAELNARLRAHPELRAQWEAEAELTEALGRLADVPVPSNFTARVLAAAQREEDLAARQRGAKPWAWSGLVNRLRKQLAFGAVIFLAGLFSYRHYEGVHQDELANSVKTLSEVASIPNVLRDFDEIQKLGPPPHADEELLKLLQ